MRVTALNLPDRSGANIIKDLYNGAWCKGGRIGGVSMPPLSLLYALAAATTEDTDARMVDGVQERLSGRKLVTRLAGTELLIAHTSAYTLADDTLTLLELRRALPDTSFALFGNLLPEQANTLIDQGAADFVCRQDPEATFAELRECLVGPGRLSRPVAALHARDNPAPEPRAAVELDTLRPPDRSKIAHLRYRNPLARHAKWTTALTSRGCPFACTFCNTPGYYQRRYRRHGTEYVVEELKAIEKHGFKEVFFRDDLFHAGAVKALCEAMIRADLRLVWSCNHRVDTLDEETIRLMAKAGCHTIKFGVESGDDGVLVAIGKPVHARALETFALCRKYGIRTHAHLIIGLPGESRAQMESTVELLEKLSPYTFTMGMFTPHPGSALHDKMKKDGTLVGGQWKERVVGNPSQVSDVELRALLRRTYLRFYLSPGRLASYALDVRRLPDLAGAGTRLVRDFVGGQA